MTSKVMNPDDCRCLRRGGLVSALIGFMVASVAWAAAPIPAEQAVNEGFANRWRLCFSPKTSLFYGCAVGKVKKAETFRNGLYDWYPGSPEGYGAGIGDCALNHGVALSGCVDRWETLSRRGLKAEDPQMSQTSEWAAALARGLLNLSSKHGYAGFVARGLCEEDGKSICSLSSVDQHTHWVHGLWRYVHSTMARPEIVAEFKTRISEVAARMERTIAPENGWNFGLCDGRPDPRGICRMWGDPVGVTASARLASIYAVAYEQTKDVHWRDCYERIADAACARAADFDQEKSSDPKWKWRVPAYVLLQMNSSLEVLLGCERGERRRANILAGMRMAAAEANARVKASAQNAKVKWYGMCAEGELALAQLMSPDSTFDDVANAALDRAIGRTDRYHWGTFMATHYFAAYWRRENRR